MRINLIRHGCTAGNLGHRYVGSTDEPLTKEALRLLEENKGYYPRPDCVFVSPLVRCIQTAGALFPEMEPGQVPLLREIDFGEFEYKNYEELKEDARYQEWIDSKGAKAFPGGESRKAFTRRCCEAFEKACREASRKGAREVAFVVHGGTIMAILDEYSRPHRDYFEWQVKNGEGFSCELHWAQDEEDISLHHSLYLTKISPLPYPPGLTGIENTYVMKQNKKLRCGYTTGTCAAAAAQAAAQMLLSGRMCFRVDLLTPKGIRLRLPIEEQYISADEKLYAECTVRKYAGDDPDATDGIRIHARADFIDDKDVNGIPAHEKDTNAKSSSARNNNAKNNDVKDTHGYKEAGNESMDGVPDDFDTRENSGDSVRTRTRVVIEGGMGVGRVTKLGLEQPVGEAAINRVPREMIAREVEAVCEAFDYKGRLKITISVPEGVEIAKRTFNPHLGIEGGISILGTSGIVVPMSEEALIASIRVEMKQKVASGERYILVTPGNYGEDFIRRGGEALFGGRKCPERSSQGQFYSLPAEDSMKCSNYVGETLDIAQELGAEGILFVAHIGKFIKVSGGIMNTHSAHADCRAELIAAQAMRAGTPPEIVRQLLNTNTTEEAVGILLKAGWLEAAMDEVTRRIHFHLQKHCKGALQTEAIIYSSLYGYLGETEGAGAMAEKIARRDVFPAPEA
ncbi:MAG: cobalt-precorrin-5B (C(1))-methyltransferase CbiD [Lachnospiraceae bacterium]|nr:cobalt-precorrin-5B (C(1))-methyltransferase CbiD [Lachnospiraceae bacterium]